MTIRQYLRRRSDRFARTAFVSLLGVGVLITYAPRILAIRIVFAVLICVGVLAAFWSLLEASCPHCGKPMGRLGFWLAIGAKRDAISRCPNCQFDVDAVLPELPKS